MSNDSMRAGKRGSSRTSCNSSSTRSMSGFKTRKRCSKAICAFFSTSSIISRFSPALRVEDAHAPPLALRQSLLQQLAVFEVHGHVNLARHVVGRVVLRQHVAQRNEAASNESSSGRSSQKNSRRPTILPSRMVKSWSARRGALAVEAEDVDVEVRRRQPSSAARRRRARSCAGRGTWRPSRSASHPKPAPSAARTRRPAPCSCLRGTSARRAPTRRTPRACTSPCTQGPRQRLM